MCFLYHSNPNMVYGSLIPLRVMFSPKGSYLDSQVAGNYRPLDPKVDHYWFKVAHNDEPVALQVALGLVGPPPHATLQASGHNSSRWRREPRHGERPEACRRGENITSFFVGRGVAFCSGHTHVRVWASDFLESHRSTLQPACKIHHSAIRHRDPRAVIH